MANHIPEGMIIVHRNTFRVWSSYFDAVLSLVLSVLSKEIWSKLLCLSLYPLSAKWKKKHALWDKKAFRFTCWTQHRLNWCRPIGMIKRTSVNRDNVQTTNEHRQTTIDKLFPQHLLLMRFLQGFSFLLRSLTKNNHPRQSSPHPNFNNFHPNKKSKNSKLWVFFHHFHQVFCFTCCFFSPRKIPDPWTACLTATAAPRIKAWEKPELRGNRTGNDTLN